MFSAVIRGDPLSGHPFVFRSRSGDRVKVLYRDRDGYAIWYKRLEMGTFHLPEAEPGAESVEIEAGDLALILEGIEIATVERRERFVPAR